jgi:hypothetical protein
MRDFVLGDGFLQSCIDLPGKIRENIVSQLYAFSTRPRDRELGVERVEGSKRILKLPVGDIYRIILDREKSVTTLLLVAENNPSSASAFLKRRVSPDQMITAPVDALETLLVEEKYLLLAKHLLSVPAATRELQFKVSEIEALLNMHLPPEARRFPGWWANQKSGKRAQAFAWMAAGWLVSKVDFNSKLVKFSRRNPRVEGGS